MRTVSVYWSIAKTLSRASPFPLLAYLLWIPVRKKLLGRKAVRVRLWINGSYYRFFLRDAADIAALREVFVEKEYALPDIAATRIVDIGAHIGCASLFFATQYPEADVVAYEPEPDNFETLKRNMQPFKNVSCVNAAVSDQEGAIDFYISPSSLGSSLYEREGSRKITVCSRTLDQVLSLPVDVLKFDIEGAEHTLFSASKRRDIPRFIIGELHYDLMGTGLDDFLKLFEKHDHTITPINQTRSTILLRRRSV